MATSVSEGSSSPGSLSRAGSQRSLSYSAGWAAACRGVLAAASFPISSSIQSLCCSRAQLTSNGAVPHRLEHALHTDGSDVSLPCYLLMFPFIRHRHLGHADRAGGPWRRGRIVRRRHARAQLPPCASHRFSQCRCSLSGKWSIGERESGSCPKHVQKIPAADGQFVPHHHCRSSLGLKPISWSASCWQLKDGRNDFRCGVPNERLDYAGAAAMTPQGKLMIQVNVYAGRHMRRRAQSFHIPRGPEARRAST